MLAVFTATLIASEAIAGGYALSGIGARAQSMAGAYRAVADDWSAVYYNPAGLARIEKSQLNFDLGFASHRPSYDPDVSLNGYTFGYPTGERYPDDQVTYFPNFGAVLVAPFGFPGTVAFAMYEPFDENLEWDLYRFAEGYNPNNELLPDIEYRNNIDVLDFQASFATSFADDKFHVGLGLSLYRGDLHTSQISLVPSTLDYKLSARPYDMFVKWTDADVWGFGFGFDVGMLYDITEKVSIGANYRSKSKIKMDGDVVARFYTPDNPEIQPKYDQNEYPEIDTIFSGVPLDGTHQADIDMTIPSQFGVGISFKPSEKVTLAADFAYTMWSEFEDLEVDFTYTRGPQGINSWPTVQGIIFSEYAYPYDWDDAIRLSLGIEGQANENIKVRGGYSYDQSPVPDEAGTPLITDTGDSHHIAAGLSYFVSIFEFAAAAEFVAMPERDVETVEDFNDDGVWDNLSGTYKNTALNTSFSVTIRF